MKGIYLASYKAIHEKYNIVYQDINGKRDISGNMLDIDLTPYDFIIATPPCNYWSRANCRRETSKYAQETKHLLPDIIEKLYRQDKPYIIENVRNDRLFKVNNLYDFPCFIYKIGRHTYWTNVKLDISDIPQRQDYKYGGKVIKYEDIQNSSANCQGGFNVHVVIERFLETIHKEDKMNDNKIMRLEKDQYGNCFKVIKGRYFIISLEEYNQILKDMLEDE